MAGAESTTGCQAELEPVVSLVDVLEEDEELENEACAVLGGSDSEKCSYSQVRAAGRLRPLCLLPACRSRAGSRAALHPGLPHPRPCCPSTLSLFPVGLSLRPAGGTLQAPVLLVVSSWWPAFHELILVTSQTRPPSPHSSHSCRVLIRRQMEKSGVKEKWAEFENLSVRVGCSTAAVEFNC